MATSVTDVAIHLEKNDYRLPGLAALLSGGFEIKAMLPCPLSTLLVEQVGIPSDYLQNRLQTLFLNGDPVDDVENTAVHAQDTLALSAAMPGLVGATMRKQGPLASLRRQLAPSDSSSKKSADGQGAVSIKLFNMVVGELGPIFLASGIVIPREALCSFIGTAGRSLKKMARQIEVNKKTATPGDLLSVLPSGQDIYLTILAETVPVAH
jgi:hypothetical protein